MKRKMLAVMPVSTNYLSTYQVDVAHSFEQAREMILSAEREGAPYESLDLPVGNEARFWKFVELMQEGHRNYPFSIFGAKNDEHFWSIAEKVRAKGFHFNS